MNKRFFWLAAAVLWCIDIFIATGSTSSTGGHTQFIIQQYLGLSPSQAATLNVVFRKSVHLGAFGLLAVLLYKGLEKNKFLLAWFFTTFYAATDELHQFYVPNRTASIFDVGLDSIGALAALGLIQAMQFLRRSHKRPYKNA